MRNTEKDELMMSARRELILEQGFRLFSENGIPAVTMQQVADACGIGIATLYRYYNTKRALVIDIARAQWEEYAEHVNEVRKRIEDEDLTAAERMNVGLGFYIDLYRNHSAMLCFNQDFNNFVRHEGITQDQLAPYLEAINVFAGMFRDAYRKGREDGTLQGAVSEEKLFAASAHIMMAVAVRYAQGLVYSAENEADRTEELQMVRRMLMREFTTPPEA